MFCNIASIPRGNYEKSHRLKQRWLIGQPSLRTAMSQACPSDRFQGWYGRRSVATNGETCNQEHWARTYACDSGWIRVMGLIYGDVPWGRAIQAGSGRLHWFMGMRHGGVRLDQMMGLIGGVAPWGRATLAGSGRWDWFMGACDIGWTGAMGLIHGGTAWGHATLAGSGQWDWFIGARHRGARPWLDWGDGFDWWGLATLAGPGRWDWFMGVRDSGWNGAMALVYGDASWGCATGSGRWDWFMGARHGVRHWLDVGDGIELWGHAMGAPDWIGVMELICGGEPWGHTTLTRSGRWDWFFVGAQWGRVTLAGSGWWDWFMGTCQMTKWYGCWI